MRTTLTLDPDVAIALKRLRKQRDARLKHVINDVLREGLRHLEETPKPKKPFRTKVVSVGRFLVGNVDNVAEALAIAEGEDFK
jgi:hypothetical protein